MANGQVLNRVNFPDPLQAANALAALQTSLFSGQTQFMNGQYNNAARFVQQQFTLPSPASTPSPTAPVMFPQDPPQVPSIPESITSQSYVNINSPANVQFIDDVPSQSFGSHVLFKRNEKPAPATATTARKVVKVKRIVRAPNGKKVNKKRALIALSDGSIIDDKNIADTTALAYDGLAQFGAGDFQDSLTKQGDAIEDEIRAHDREAAEDEVRAVLSLCSACQVEPFIGAVAFAWKDAKIVSENALKGHSVGGCGAF